MKARRRARARWPHLSGSLRRPRQGVGWCHSSGRGSGPRRRHRRPLIALVDGAVLFVAQVRDYRRAWARFRRLRRPPSSATAATSCAATLPRITRFLFASPRPRGLSALRDRRLRFAPGAPSAFVVADRGRRAVFPLASSLRNFSLPIGRGRCLELRLHGRVHPAPPAGPVRHGESKIGSSCWPAVSFSMTLPCRLLAVRSGLDGGAPAPSSWPARCWRRQDHARAATCSNVAWISRRRLGMASPRSARASPTSRLGAARHLPLRFSPPSRARTQVRRRRRIQLMSTITSARRATGWSGRSGGLPRRRRGVRSGWSRPVPPVAAHGAPRGARLRSSTSTEARSYSCLAILAGHLGRRRVGSDRRNELVSRSTLIRRHEGSSRPCGLLSTNIACHERGRSADLGPSMWPRHSHLPPVCRCGVERASPKDA